MRRPCAAWRRSALGAAALRACTAPGVAYRCCYKQCGERGRRGEGRRTAGARALPETAARRAACCVSASGCGLAAAHRALLNPAHGLPGCLRCRVGSMPTRGCRVGACSLRKPSRTRSRCPRRAGIRGGHDLPRPCKVQCDPGSLNIAAQPLTEPNFATGSRQPTAAGPEPSSRPHRTVSRQSTNQIFLTQRSSDHPTHIHPQVGGQQSQHTLAVLWQRGLSRCVRHQKDWFGSLSLLRSARQQQSQQPRREDTEVSSRRRPWRRWTPWLGGSPSRGLPSRSAAN